MSAAVSAALGVQSARGQLVFDLTPPRRKQRTQLGWDAVDLGDALADRFPLDAEPGGELLAEVSPVQVAGGVRVPVELLGVKGAPASVLAIRDVRDEDVGVELGVTGTTRAAHEPSGDEPIRSNAFVAVDPATRPARLVFQPAERRVDCGVVRSADLAGRVGVSESPQHGHGLGGREREIEPRDPVFPELAQRRPGFRVTATKHRTQRVRIHTTRQIQVARPVAGPFSG